MRLARPADTTPDAEPTVYLADGLDALRAGTPEHIGDLLLQLLNRFEALDYARTEKDKRGSWEPTLPPGYRRRDANLDRPGWDSDAARAYREFQAEQTRQLTDRR